MQISTALFLHLAGKLTFLGHCTSASKTKEKNNHSEYINEGFPVKFECFLRNLKHYDDKMGCLVRGDLSILLNFFLKNYLCLFILDYRKSIR